MRGWSLKVLPSFYYLFYNWLLSSKVFLLYEEQVCAYLLSLYPLYKLLPGQLLEKKNPKQNISVCEIALILNYLTLKL